MNTIEERFKGYIAPGRIAGNTYFVGTVPASTHIIDTGDGLIMIDPGYAEPLPIIIDSVWRLGFDPMDVKKILISHGHLDHFGAVPMMKAISGAEVYIGEYDADCARGKQDYSWAKELKKPLVTFEPDHEIKDGDVITLGNTSVRCFHTPGHTPGVCSFLWNVEHNGKCYTAGMHGGVGFNTLSGEYLTNNRFSFDLRDKFIAGCRRLLEEKVEIFIGNHVQNNDTVGKLAKVAAGDENAFICEDGSEWKNFLNGRINALNALIEKEKNQ